MIYNYGISTEKLIQRYKNEYLILTQSISHDNIIKIFTYFPDRPTEDMLKILPKETTLERTTLVMIMEYIPNNLKNYLELNFSNLPISRLLSICIGIGEGLIHLLKEKIVHRDLKLENILIDDEGYPIICDFGLAAKLEDNFTFRFSDLDPPGGNTSHLAPEILNAFKQQKKREKKRNRDRLFKTTIF